jgi:predicted AlkP superfamily pyrophosphatase or phosphodiesterase
MNTHVVLLSVPGLRSQDLNTMPKLQSLMAGGEQARLVPSFPCVTCPVQANMTTGRLPKQHGVIANGFYWRDKRQVEMWTAWNDCIESPQIWDLLGQHDASLTSAVWFPLHSKGAEADYICTPAPIHNPDGSESLWCYTRPTELYGTLRDQLGHFPLQHFWGPMANIRSTAWIADSAMLAAAEFRPNFFYIYLPHLDYAAQKTGPESEPALKALADLDEVIGRLSDGVQAGLGEAPIWIAASEYGIVPVDHVLYPNRLLRLRGLLKVRNEADGEHLDLERSQAWAMVDHQLSHIFCVDDTAIGKAAQIFQNMPGVAEVLVGPDRAKYGLDHPRSGEIVLISTTNSWQAYYWWNEDEKAPGFARTVDIHRKPGYDPVELHFDMATKSIPLDASLVKGSHGAPAVLESQRGTILSSQTGVLGGNTVVDTDVFDIVLRQYGIR